MMSDRFREVRDHFGPLTDHEFRVVMQCYPGQQVLALPDSSSGRALTRNDLATTLDDDSLRLTVNGMALSRYLYRNHQRFFGPDDPINRLRNWLGSLFANEEIPTPPPAKSRPLWSASDEEHLRELYLSGISAFWLHPDGIEAGLAALDV